MCLTSGSLSYCARARDRLRRSPAIPGGTKTLNLLSALNHEYLREYVGFSGNYALDCALISAPESLSVPLCLTHISRTLPGRRAPALRAIRGSPRPDRNVVESRAWTRRIGPRNNARQRALAGGNQMARIRHIALATRNPDAAAEFYQRAFAFKEVGKFSAREADGYYLTDGALNMALLKFKPGALVGWISKVESLGAECFFKPDKNAPSSYVEVKFRGPDRTVFDIAAHPWPISGSAHATIRHIAVATQNPDATAQFYKRAFGFEEMRKVAGELAHGYFLSDGATNMAILKFRGPDQLGKGLDYTGLHHFGLLVDDVKAWTARLESMGAECFMRAPERPGNNHFEVKFRGPDGVVFDIAQHPWPGSAAIEVEAAEKAAAG